MYDDHPEDAFDPTTECRLTWLLRHWRDWNKGKQVGAWFVDQAASLHVSDDEIITKIDQWMEETTEWAEKMIEAQEKATHGELSEAGVVAAIVTGVVCASTADLMKKLELIEARVERLEERF